MDEVVLEYKREGSHLSTGRIVVRREEEEGLFLQFEGWEFKDMLRSYCEALQKYPDARAVWQRNDRPGLVPYVLDQAVTELLRKDPVAGIESLSPPAISPSSTIRRVRAERAPVPVSIRAGFDTLADSFGDEVYVKHRNGRIECPGCGIWLELVSEMLEPGSFFNCRNPRCAFHTGTLYGVKLTERWAAIAVSDLIYSKSKRFYLPRAWNDGRPWISMDDLSRKYLEYKKEKEQWATSVVVG